MSTFLLTLLAVSIAELGDKTQLVAIYLSARFRRPFAILAGILVAATANLGLAVLFGGLLALWLGDWLNWLVAGLFIVLGAHMLRPGEDDDDADVPATPSARGAFLTTCLLFFLMEMGDKTQLATFGLAASLEQPGLVLAGGVAALTLVNAPAVWLGHRYASRMPQRLLHRLSGVLFVLIGIGVLVLSAW